MKLAQPLSILACCVIVMSCDDNAPNVPLSYPPASSSLAVANFAVSVPVNTATTAAVPVINPRSDLVVTVVTAPVHGTLAATSAFVGLTYTPATDYLGEDSAVVLVTATGDASVQLRATATFDVHIPFEITAPDGITALPGVTFAFTGDNAISVTHRADVDFSITQTLTTDLGTLSLGVTAGIEFVADADDVTSDGVDDTTIIFSGDLASVNAALASLTLNVASDADLTATGTLTISSDDGELDTFGSPRAPQVAAVDIVLAEAPPVPLSVSGPSSQTTNEDTALVFSAGNGNRLLITDDQGAAASTISVELNASHGIVTLASSSGITFTTGNASGGATLHFNGQKAAVLAAIETVTFTPDSNFNGSNGQLVFSASSPTGTDSLTVAVTVSAVNDAPTVNVPANFTATQGTSVTMNSSRSSSVADIDSVNLSVTYAVSGGTLAVGNAGGLNVTGGGTATITLGSSSSATNNVSAINNALSSITWTVPTTPGNYEFTVTVKDSANATTSDQFTVTVTN